MGSNGCNLPFYGRKGWSMIEIYKVIKMDGGETGFEELCSFETMEDLFSSAQWNEHQHLVSLLAAAYNPLTDDREDGSAQHVRIPGVGWRVTYAYGYNDEPSSTLIRYYYMPDLCVDAHGCWKF
jgi:hypothetical protein